MSPDDYILKAISIMISLMILPFAYLLKIKCKSWVAPSVVFTLFWFLLTFLPLVVMFSVPSNPFAMVYIFACLLAFSMPSLLTTWTPKNTKNEQKSTVSADIYNSSFLTISFYSMQIVVVLCIFINLSIQGYSPYDFLTDLTGTAYRYLNDRYSGNIEANFFSRTGTLLNYTANCIGGLIIARKTNPKKLLVFLFSFVPACLYMVVYADKGTLFQCAAFFYSGVLVARISSGDFSLTNKKTNRVIFFSLICLLPILILSFLARGIGGGTTEETIDKLLYYFSSYAFGHFYAFSDWFSSVYSGYSIAHFVDSGENTYGLYTFMALFKALGSTAFIPEGYYDEYYNFNNIIQSNIYTMFRGTITDFSAFGALTYFLLSGLFFNAGYISMLKNARPIFSPAIYMCFIAYTYSSFLISIMTWNSIFAVFILVSLLLWINRVAYGKRLVLRSTQTH
ncbi:O-antigen polymerase [Pseudomonas pergaminensis]|uniref:O-antigen polymerase n=1 Tax=Pseudomonas pergaminensis TaxID=2853159 RepID=A0ABW8QZ80_9PSED